ncbi:MAG TPA: hypothetical protein VKG43_07880 [Acidimicrobiales bacterium]|nr:hypothetical protein [Acidimicrobiales bacterium]
MSTPEAGGAALPGSGERAARGGYGEQVQTEGPAGRPHRAGTVEAAEAAVEGLPGALSLAPSATVPVIGGELILPERGAGRNDGDVAPDTVRRGLLQAGPLAVAGLVANGANVVVTILLARMLSTGGYGSLAQLVGIFLIVSMPGSAITVGVVRRVTAWHGSGSAHLVQRWARRVHRQGTTVLIAFALLAAAVGVPLSSALGQPHPVALVAMVVAGGLWVLFSLDRGLLQAHRDYKELAYNLLVEGGVRTGAVLVLVAAGLGVVGAALGYLVAELVTAVHARATADRRWAGEVAEAEARGEYGLGLAAAVRQGTPGVIWRRWKRAFGADERLAGPLAERRDIFVDLATAFVAMGLLALLQNIDVIVVAKEDPHLSGSYAAISVASKALVFGAVALSAYLLPEAAIRWHQGGHALRQLLVTLLLLAVPATLLLALALGAPHLLLTVVFGARYLGAESAFAPLVVAMICLSVTVVLTMYLLAVGRRWIAGVLLVGAAAATVAVAAAHGAPRATARADMVVQAALALVTIVGFATVHHRRLRPR